MELKVQQIVLSLVAALQISGSALYIWVERADTAATASALALDWRDRPLPWVLRRVSVVCGLFFQVIAVDIVGELGIYSLTFYALWVVLLQAFMLATANLWIYSSARMLFRQMHAPLPPQIGAWLAVAPALYVVVAESLLLAYYFTDRQWAALSACANLFASLLAGVTACSGVIAYRAVRDGFTDFVKSVSPTHATAAAAPGGGTAAFLAVTTPRHSIVHVAASPRGRFAEPLAVVPITPRAGPGGGSGTGSAGNLLALSDDLPPGRPANARSATEPPAKRTAATAAVAPAPVTELVVTAIDALPSGRPESKRSLTPPSTRVAPAPNGADALPAAPPEIKRSATPPAVNGAGSPRVSRPPFVSQSSGSAPSVSHGIDTAYLSEALAKFRSQALAIVFVSICGFGLLLYTAMTRFLRHTDPSNEPSRFVACYVLFAAWLVPLYHAPPAAKLWRRRFAFCASARCCTGCRDGTAAVTPTGRCAPVDGASLAIEMTSERGAATAAPGTPPASGRRTPQTPPAGATRGFPKRPATPPAAAAAASATATRANGDVNRTTPTASTSVASPSAAASPAGASAAARFAAVLASKPL